jgi:hypothetical protein
MLGRWRWLICRLRLLQRFERLLGILEDETVLGEPGYRENSKNLMLGAEGGEPATFGGEVPAGTDDGRDAGGVEELAAAQVDQDNAISGRSPERLLKFAGDLQVELTVELDHPTVRPQLSLFQLEKRHGRSYCFAYAPATQDPLETFSVETFSEPEGLFTLCGPPRTRESSGASAMLSRVSVQGGSGTGRDRDREACATPRP